MAPVSIRKSICLPTMSRITQGSSRKMGIFVIDGASELPGPLQSSRAASREADVSLPLLA